ncbi:MAG: DUF1990 family protein [Longimicrobiales bacterium]
MAEWRFLHGWSDAELVTRLGGLAELGRNFDPALPDGWSAHRSTAIVALEAAGEPEAHGAFARLCTAVADYEFSDPAIVTAHFNAASPLTERRLLLELKVLGLRYLCATVVTEVREERTADATYFGFRYDTLQGHIERGEEWFLLTKLHATGDVRFDISARWRAGDFPNWWSRIGFAVLGQHYQKRWHTRAHQRLAWLANTPEHGLLRDGRGRRVLMAHEGPPITFAAERLAEKPAVQQSNVSSLPPS